MKIRFLGLVAHITLSENTPQETQLAALVASPQHKATLGVAKRSVERDDDNIGVTSGGITCFPLTGCVKMPGLGQGAAAIRSLAGVPSLADVAVLSGGTVLSPELTKCPPDNSIFSSIIYLPPGGRLTPEDFYKYEVDFNARPFGPLARTVIYLVSTSSSVLVNIDGHLVTLKYDAEIVIANVCKASAGDHFEDFKLVFYPPATTVYVPNDSKKRPCQFYTAPSPISECGGTADLGVDCSNSHFP